MYVVNQKQKDEKAQQAYALGLQTKQSMKGLFTFYRQQQELEEKFKEIENIKKLKQQEKIKITPQFSLQKLFPQIEQKLSEKIIKNRSSKTISHNHQLKNKKLKQKSMKKLKHEQTDCKQEQNYCQTKQIKEYPNSKKIKTQPSSHHIENINNQQDLSHRFLKKIKSRKELKSSFVKIGMAQQQLGGEKEMKKLQNKSQEYMQRFLKQQSLTRVNPSKLQKYEVKKCFKDRQQQIGQFLSRRNNKSALKREHVDSRTKRIYTQIPTVNINDEMLRKNGLIEDFKRNFYSPSKLKQISGDKQYLKTEQSHVFSQFDPISPPSMNTIQRKQKSIDEFEQEENTNKNKNESLKFPYLKNATSATTKLKNQLHKLKKSTTPLHHYDSGKYLKAGKNLAEEFSSESGRQSEFRNKSISISKQKLFSYIEHERQGKEYLCLALVDMSKSDINEMMGGNTSWLTKKKLLLKKLGLKV